LRLRTVSLSDDAASALFWSSSSSLSLSLSLSLPSPPQPAGEQLPRREKRRATSKTRRKTKPKLVAVPTGSSSLAGLPARPPACLPTLPTPALQRSININPFAAHDKRHRNSTRNSTSVTPLPLILYYQLPVPLVTPPLQPVHLSPIPSSTLDEAGARASDGLFSHEFHGNGIVRNIFPQLPRSSNSSSSFSRDHLFSLSLCD
jgi:hypothetical protein